MSIIAIDVKGKVIVGTAVITIRNTGTMKDTNYTASSVDLMDTYKTVATNLLEC